jgi:hypothetical protein
MEAKEDKQKRRIERAEGMKEEEK